jgi:DNA modification methylase
MGKANPNSVVGSTVQEIRAWSDSTSKGNSWAIHCGDAATVLARMEEQIFDCVVTSPPYFWLRDYQVAQQIGREETVTEYIDAICAVMKQVSRVLKTTGSVFLNLGDTYYSGRGESRSIDEKNKKRRFGLRAVDRGGGLGLGLKSKSLIGIPWRVAIRMAEQGWVLRSSIIWHRKNTFSEVVKDRPRRSYEYIFLFVKNRRYYFNRSHLTKDSEEDLWVFTNKPTPSNGVKTAPFPEELVERCVSLGCPERGHVLDPFVGSGTTVKVAVASGRNGTGIDLNETYCRHAVKQLAAVKGP